MANLEVSSNVDSFMGAADYAAMRTLLGLREVLTADRTYYVRTDGIDSNDGLANTSGGAFLTVQKAIDTAAMLDISIYNVTIQIGDGTYSVASANILKTIVGAGLVTIQGNAGTPANVVISSSGDFSDGLFTARNILGRWRIQDLRLTSTHTNVFLLHADAARLEFQNVQFHSATNSHIRPINTAQIVATGNYAITGGTGGGHIGCANNALFVCQNRTVTLSGTPAIGIFCSCRVAAVVRIEGNTYSGSATGIRYDLQEASVVFTGSAGASYFPGNSAGSIASNAVYN